MKATSVTKIKEITLVLDDNDIYKLNTILWYASCYMQACFSAEFKTFIDDLREIITFK
jgi:hypothetical protein